MRGSPDHASAVDHLTALIASAALPERDLAYCAQLREGLTRQARVTVIGLPGCDLAPVRGAVMGEATLGAEWPDIPIDLRYGPSARSLATLVDGTTLESTDGPSPESWDADVIFLQIHLPLAALDRMQILSLPLPTGGTSQSRALQWAAERSEIAIWCAASEADLTPALWASAPDRLKTYAYLVLTDPERRSDPSALSHCKHRFGFDGVFARQRDAASLAPFARQIATDIDDARQADLDAVQLFLHHRGQDIARRASPSATPHRAAPSPERIARLSDPILYLKRRAKGLSDLLDWAEDGFDWTEAVLGHCCETTDGLRERAYDWPEDDPITAALSETIEEACDTAVLLQIEAGTARAEDAAALLFQLRGAFEHALAA